MTPGGRDNSTGLLRYLGGRWLYIKNLLSTNLIFIPALCLLGALALAAVSVQFDYLGGGQWLQSRPWFPDMAVDSAQALLSTIATAIITVASLIFSLTFIALTIASQQLGPRLISRAMTDRLNQVVLGTFVGTFVYTLIVLSATDDNASGIDVPLVSIAIVGLLALVCFALLIIFVHHTAVSIQADHVLSWQADALMEAIDEIFPEEAVSQPERPDFDTADADALCARRSGYVQVVDRDALAEIAEEADITIVLDCRPGHFIPADLPLGHVFPRGRIGPDVADAIHDAVVLGPVRTPAQDYEYHFRAIIDVGVRALSPSINDFHTAMSTLDWVGGAIGRIMARGLPPAVVGGEGAKPRVWLYPVTMERIVQLGFQQFIEAARGNVPVMVHVLVVLTALARLTRDDAQRAAITAVAEEVISLVGAMDTLGPDAKELSRRCNALRDALGA